MEKDAKNIFHLFGLNSSTHGVIPFRVAEDDINLQEIEIKFEENKRAAQEYVQENFPDLYTFLALFGFGTTVNITIEKCGILVDTPFVALATFVRSTSSVKKYFFFYSCFRV